MDKQKNSVPTGDIRLEMREIDRMQNAGARDSMDMARYTKTTGGIYTPICC